MLEAQTIVTDHKDLIHDVAYDFYGERVATCSSDQYVKIWDMDNKGNWQLTASWKAHHGSVWKVTWAHPEFGQVIATCSFDRTAAVWEEAGDMTIPSEKTLRQWVKRSNLVDSRTSVTDVKFGPKSLGLLLVTSSADGVIRMYEAPDVMNLSQWTLQYEIPTKVPISCISWNPSLSRINPPMLAVGSDDPINNANTSSGTSTFEKPVVSQGKVFLFEYSEASRRWAKTDTIPSVLEPVHDLAFAPNLGRSYHLLAIATKDVRIIKIEPVSDSSNIQNGGVAGNGSANNSGGSGAGNGGGGVFRYKCDVIAAFDDHASTVWRVSWNVTGTLLASSGDDCYVRLWKMQFSGSWRCVGVLKGARGTEPPPQSATSPTLPHTAHYLKLGTISNPNQVPWH